MVSQGVKNPLIDLTALEDKTLDEVSTWQPLSPLVSFKEKMGPSPVKVTTKANSKTHHLLGCCNGWVVNIYTIVWV